MGAAEDATPARFPEPPAHTPFSWLVQPASQLLLIPPTVLSSDSIAKYPFFPFRENLPSGRATPVQTGNTAANSKLLSLPRLCSPHCGSTPGELQQVRPWQVPMSLESQRQTTNGLTGCLFRKNEEFCRCVPDAYRETHTFFGFANQLLRLPRPALSRQTWLPSCACAAERFCQVRDLAARVFAVYVSADAYTKCMPITLRRDAFCDL